ncbi:MAG: glycoside hydrolase family 3 N-terminal domain-containing protein [Gemmatimonadales bacterium]
MSTSGYGDRLICGPTLRTARQAGVKRVLAGIAVLAAFALPGALAAQLPVEVRARDLLARMTIEEKFWQLFMIPGDLDDPSHDYSHGVFGLQVAVRPDTARAAPGDVARAHAERINSIQRYFVERTRLGIPVVPFEEAVHGLAREGATMFPAAIALAATWDTSLMGRVAAAIAEETRSRGIRQVLSPVVNLASDVRWGRVEETYGEDPFLASAMARSFVGAFERAGVVTTPKHFVANVGEGGRDSYPIGAGDRELEELYYPPFRAAIGAGSRAVMSAYNSVHGIPATQNRALLTDVLRRDWGFAGIVISDAAATGGAVVLHRTEPNTAAAAKDAIEAGLDVIFQSSWEQHRPYLAAFQRGLISGAAIDSAVLRVLRLKLALGLFEHPYVDPDSAAALNGSAEHRRLALEAARASIVLLANDHGVLPLRRGLSRVAVIGTDAVEARLGGYSAPGVRPVSILDGIRSKAGAGSVLYAPGPGRLSPEYTVVPESALHTGSGRTSGLRGEYFDNNGLEGTPLLVRTDPRVSFGWTLNAPAPGIPYDWYSVRWTGTLTAPDGGVRQLGVEGNDGYRLYLDGRLVIDNWRKQSYRTMLADVDLVPGGVHDLRLEYFESTGNARIKLVWDAGIVPNEWSSAIDSAVAIARGSDVAIVVAGVEEGEFRDRARLGLPGHQEELIERVAAAGVPVVVVLVAGSAVTMPWEGRAAAVLDAWYPGEEGGDAVADVLFGDANPSGRLPITFPMAEGQLPLRYNHLPTGRGDDYVDLTGQPLFPFGFGLSYTTFEYSSLTIEPAEVRAGESAVVRCQVRNTGARAGAEVVQLYLHEEVASVARPVMQLEGMQRVELAPGEEREVVFALGPHELQLLDQSMRWIVEPGLFRVMVGGSSRDIRLRGRLVVR